MQLDDLYRPVLLALIGIVAVAAYIDIHAQRIPNRLILLGLVVAIGYHGWSVQGNGILFALAGLGVGMAVFMPLYAMRLMGAGDVKLMGVVGASLGARATIGAILLTLVAGGLLAIGLAIHKRKVGELSTNLSILIGEVKIPRLDVSRLAAKLPVPSVGDMPYAVAIAIGTIVQIILMQNDFTIF